MKKFLKIIMWIYISCIPFFFVYYNFFHSKYKYYSFAYNLGLSTAWIGVIPGVKEVIQLAVVLAVVWWVVKDQLFK